MSSIAAGSLTRLLPWLVVGALFLSACAPAAPGASREAGSTGGQAAQPTAPKTLRMAVVREPVDGIVVFSGSGDILKQLNYVFHSGLSTHDAQGNLQPVLASKVPRVEDGDWKVLSDGGMEVTWKLRPNIKWHDGAPLTADDFVFGIQVAKDPNLPLPHTGGVNLVKEVLAPDATTLVVRYSETYFNANEGTPAEMPALPRHLIGDLYQQGDPNLFTNSTFWTSGWVGAGPYKMGEWALGSYTEGLAFDDYVLGRPKVDRLIIRYITDTNAIIAAVLSGDIDVVNAGTLKPDDLTPVKNAWQASGEGTVLEALTDVVAARLSFRDPTAPWFSDTRVRHALVNGLDRQLMADTFYPGPKPPDIFALTDDPVYQLAQQRGFPTFPYDVSQAERVMRDAGWTRGADSTFQNAAGQKFGIQVRIVANAPVNTRRGEVLADQWKQSGFGGELFIITTQATNRPELKATSPGVFVMPDTLAPDLLDMFQSFNVATANNRWAGTNLLGYNNPEFDRLYNSYTNSLEEAKRQSNQADLLRFVADDMFYIPLYYDVGSTTTVFRRGIKGPGRLSPVQKVTPWNIHEWEMS
jgi:peptide/nickel transport system substrate-binding protein